MWRKIYKIAAELAEIQRKTNQNLNLNIRHAKHTFEDLIEN